MNVLRSSLYPNLIYYLKKNIDRGFENQSLFEIGPSFMGKKPGQQITIICGIKKEDLTDIYVIKKVNNFNQCNICPLCFEKTVDHFIDPCGHTFCKDCIQKLRKNKELDLYEIGRNDNSQCCFCKEKIKTIRQLYFL